MKKWIQFAFFLGIATILASCSKSTDTSTTVEPLVESDTTNPKIITFMASQDWVMDAEIELSKQFTEETGILVDYQIIPAEHYFDLLLSKLENNVCTDIFASQAGKFDIVSQLDIEKNAISLSQESWTARLDPLAAEEVSVDGKVYGQPMQDTSAVWAVAYNKIIFQELGLSIPTTYAEFVSVCDRILASGVTPIYECVEEGWHHTLWFTEIGSIIDVYEAGTVDRLNSNSTSFAESPTALLIVEQFKAMVDAGYLGENYMINPYEDAAKNIANGSYAMFLTQQGFHSEVSQADSSFDAQNIGYFVIPLADNQIMNMNPVSPTRFVYSGSSQSTEAKQYLEFLARPENLQYMIDNVTKYNYLPISGATTSYDDNVQEFFNRYPQQSTVYQTSVKYVNPQWMEIGEEFRNVILGFQGAATMMQQIDNNRTAQAQAVVDADW